MGLCEPARQAPRVARTHCLLRVAFAACAITVAPAFAQGGEPLRICIAEGNPPLSYKVKNEARGLDVQVAEAIAAATKRPLKPVLFEIENDRDRNSVHEINAMLSANVCELAGSFALFASDLVAPSRETARVPDHEGAPPRRQRPYIALQPLAATRAYHASALGVIVRDPALNVATLADLQQQRVGVTAGTVAGTAIARYRNGVLIAGMRSIAQREDIFAVLEAGTVDAVLAPVNKWDAHRIANPQTKLRASSYVHPFRMHLGFVALASNTALVATANEAIGRSLQNGDLQRWADATGTTWIRPAGEEVRSSFRITDLIAE
jgi:ABC-type amino acid transport substrate-binding protein